MEVLVGQHKQSGSYAERTGLQQAAAPLCGSLRYIPCQMVVDGQRQETVCKQCTDSLDSELKPPGFCNDGVPYSGGVPALQTLSPSGADHGFRRRPGRHHGIQLQHFSQPEVLWRGWAGVARCLQGAPHHPRRLRPGHDRHLARLPRQDLDECCHPLRSPRAMDPALAGVRRHIPYDCLCPRRPAHVHQGLHCEGQCGAQWHSGRRGGVGGQFAQRPGTSSG
mmetsp:Transcript_128104/g.356498  ORF Transcript_128104/g.356498 Transcript_128104/m.356498 type:complete len:222 (-) Transcript_128104:1688-2353(-)